MRVCEPMAMQPAIARQNGRGVWLYKRPLRCHISDFFSSVTDTLPCWFFADAMIRRWNASAAGLDLSQWPACSFGHPLPPSGVDLRDCKCRTVIVRRAGLPCTLMTLTPSVCHAWGNPTLTLCSSGLTALTALADSFLFSKRLRPLCHPVFFLPGTCEEKIVGQRIRAAGDKRDHNSSMPACLAITTERAFAHPLQSTRSATPRNGDSACVSALARGRDLFWLKQCVILDTAHRRKVVMTDKIWEVFGRARLDGDSIFTRRQENESPTSSYSSTLGLTYCTKGPERAPVGTIVTHEPQSTLVKNRPAASIGIGQASRRPAEPIHQPGLPGIRPNASKVVLKPRLGYVPKVLSTPFRAQVIALSTLSPLTGSQELSLLCPVRALRVYIECSASYRKSEQLFVGFGNRAKGGPVTKQGISRWLVDAITLAYSSLGL